MDQPRPLFVYFRSFQTQILQKNCRFQSDSNLDRRSRRQAHADHLTTTQMGHFFVMDFSSLDSYKEINAGLIFGGFEPGSNGVKANTHFHL